MTMYLAIAACSSINRAQYVAHVFWACVGRVTTPFARREARTRNLIDNVVVYDGGSHILSQTTMWVI